MYAAACSYRLYKQLSGTKSNACSCRSPNEFRISSDQAFKIVTDKEMNTFILLSVIAMVVIVSAVPSPGRLNYSYFDTVAQVCTVQVWLLNVAVIVIRYVNSCRWDKRCRTLHLLRDKEEYAMLWITRHHDTVRQTRYEHACTECYNDLSVPFLHIGHRVYIVTVTMHAWCYWM